MSVGRDIISITSLSLRSSFLGQDLWGRSNKSQPLLLSLSIITDVESEAINDNLRLGESLNYGIVTKTIEKIVTELNLTSFKFSTTTTNNEISLEELAEILAFNILFLTNAPNISLKLFKERSLISSKSISIQITRNKLDYFTSTESSLVATLGNIQLSPHSINSRNDKFVINELRRSIILGLNPCERLEEQEVIVDLEFGLGKGEGEGEGTMNYVGGIRPGWKGWRTVVKALESHLSSSHAGTIETLTTSLAQIILIPPSVSMNPDWNVGETTVRIAKPCALMYAKYPAVQITRSRADFFNLDGSARITTAASSLRGISMVSASNDTGSGSSSTSASTAATERRIHSAILGIGSNMGERMGNISRALKELESYVVEGERTTRIVDTSFLYESEAMYIVDQAKFLNAVVQVETTLSPLALLEALKSIEQSLGREKTVRNGPRVIDLDILFYDDLILDTRDDTGAVDDRWLKIPHASIAEREFVLRPLADLTSAPLHPLLQSTPAQLLSTLLETNPSTLHRVLPLSTSTTHPLSSRTLVMSILNATPDSFSDGGDNSTLDIALTTALTHIAAGVDIVDIGGMSTRPGASDVDVEEEINRVVPLIRAIRAQSQIPISIDTFRPEVAKRAIAAGATIVNDVLGGSTEGMVEMMSASDCPVILMHSRGTPATMNQLTQYDQGVVEGVKQEMRSRVEKAMKAGVKRWNIIVDPGIGFAKTGQDNLLLLRQLPIVLERDSVSGGFPSLVGLSRKKFLGTLTGKDNPKDRMMATATGVTCSIAGGADIVRVHDVQEMLDVVRVADGIYRN